MAEDKLHIAMFPWLALGHMTPWLQLAKLVAQRGHRVSFISTPRNIDRLPKIPPNLSPLLQFVKIPLPQLSDLPPNVEATSDLPYNKVQYLKKAYDMLQTPMLPLLASLQPDWILYDFTAYWLPPISSQLAIGNVFFSIFLAAPLAFLGPPSSLINGDGDRTEPKDFTVPPKWAHFQTTVAYRYFEIKQVFESVTGDVSGVSDFVRFGSVIQNSDVVAIRSCYEFEPEWFRVLETLYQKPVLPVGQLPTTGYDDGDGTDTWRGIEEWLDKQKKSSVVYVAFGSEAKPSQTQLTELALGLEISKLPFFWVLRTRRGSEDTELVELPNGFEERTIDRGVVCTSWAPQLKILSHDSVGGMLSHSGWSSVVEAIQCERPLVLLTFLADQGLNARIFEEKKIGYSIPRNEMDGWFTKESVAESLELVMVKEEGRVYRDNVKKTKELFGDRARQDRYVDDFLRQLKNKSAGSNVK